MKVEEKVLTLNKKSHEFFTLNLNKIQTIV